VNDVVVRVIAVHPAPGLNDQYPAFLETMRVLREEVRQSPYPIVLAGDFNGSRWVPAVGELFGAGLTSAHEAMGYGLSSSWPEGGRVPIFMRLDQVLYNDRVAATHLNDAIVPGSDHRAIVVDLLVRPATR
jgi:endonuclease/exonuclease/phosphatase (EEP) superfamily protein YafD